ncbi:MAG: hypothetical protein NUW01_03505 [Gemmatimonadaceae bacterium]|nr:hypothetical protein [Gemmatimonadaceae bacterium]
MTIKGRVIADIEALCDPDELRRTAFHLNEMVEIDKRFGRGESPWTRDVAVPSLYAAADRLRDLEEVAKAAEAWCRRMTTDGVLLWFEERQLVDALSTLDRSGRTE